MRVRAKLDATFFHKGMPFRPDSPMQQKVAAAVAKRGLPMITNDEVYKAAEYQAFTKGNAIGKLHVVPVGTAYESLNFDRHDIVLLQESYPDITPGRGDPRDPVLDAAVARQPARRRVGHPERRRQAGAREVRQARRQVRLLRGHRHAHGAAARDRRRGQGAAGPDRAAAHHVDLPPADLDESRGSRC